MSDRAPDGGSGFYDDAAAVDDYLAHRHSAVSSPNLVMEEPAFAEEVGDLAGLRILDLGCGDGTFAADAVRGRCRSYVGVDAARAMIRRASDRQLGASVSLVHAAIERFEPPAAAFDLVVSRLALHYVEDLAPVFTGVHRALAPGGRFVFTVAHPVITSARHQSSGPRSSLVVDDYFAPGPRTRQWFGRPVVWRHRTVEDYVAPLFDAGFSPTGLRECAPVEALFGGDTEELERRRRVPVFLLLSADA